MTRQAVAYIRRSSGHESPLSLQAQTDAVTTAAQVRGDSIARTYKDWGKSGGDRDRPAFLDLRAAIEAGTIRAVYAYDADRLSRRESTLHLLLDAAEEARTAIVDRTGRDLADKHNRLTAGVLASVDAQMLRDITERNRANRANRANRDENRRRGDDMGEAPYGWSKARLTEAGTNSRGEPAEAGAVVNVCTDPDAILTVVNAYAAAGSALGTAQLLNAIGHTTKRGKAWNNRGVTEVVEREAPELLPARLGRKHARHYRTRVLSGVMRCRCGTVMSPNGAGWTCSAGMKGVHERPYNVNDAIVMPWVREEAERMRVPIGEVEESGVEDERAALEVKRSKLLDVYLDDMITKAEMDAKMRDLDARMEALEVRAGIHDVPRRIDWGGWSDSAINDVLRSLFTVELGDDMRPARAVWYVPEWRDDGRKPRPRPRRRPGPLAKIRARVKRT